MTGKRVYRFQPLQKLKWHGLTTIVMIETSNDWLIVIPKDEESVNCTIRNVARRSTVTTMLHKE
jgi:hypothetical protein